MRLNGAKLYIANTAEIKLRRQAKAFLQVAEFGYGALAAYLGGDDSAAANAAAADTAALAGFRDAVKAAENLLILIGSELRGAELKRLIDFGLDASRREVCAACGLCQLSRRGRHGPAARHASRLHAHRPHRHTGPRQPHCDRVWLADRARPGHAGDLRRGRQREIFPLSTWSGRTRLRDTASIRGRSKDTFVVVQEMFLTETAALADVVLPAANLYEKSGSVTNSYGDLQQVKKAGDRAGVRTDFEMIVRIADKMGADVRKLVPFGSGCSRGDMGARPAARSPARRTAMPCG